MSDDLLRRLGKLAEKRGVGIIDLLAFASHRIFEDCVVGSGGGTRTCGGC